MLPCRALFFIAISLALGLLGSCASSPPGNPAEPPPDFTLAITVLSRENPQVDRDPRTLARPYRPGRYILEPDGVLRVAIGTGALPKTFPPAMRRLTFAQRNEVWELASSAGYMAIPAEQSINAAASPAAVSRPTAMIYVVAGDSTRGLQISLDAPTAEPSRVLIDRLAELAWVEK